ncbi:MAG: macro domain-containing protein [Chloroflexi bacterium]|nr:MAG: macro domain-containing protein [Chloroflexota bacterium]
MTALHYVKGDIFESKAQVIVNTVNCKGVMGKGLALAFKHRYPEMFLVYQEECKIGKIRIGRPSLYKQSTPWILNFPTKDNWKANSKIEYLEKGLQYFVANYKMVGIKSIAFPKLGAQNGKLSWDDVGPLMAKYLGNLDIDVYIYIAEGDREYLNNNEIEIAIWKLFNELAHSPDKLQGEIGLNARDAKKIAEACKSVEFTSLSNIANVEGLAKISLQKIKKFIDDQQYFPNELPGITQDLQPVQRNTKNGAHSSKPKRALVRVLSASADDSSQPALI